MVSDSNELIGYKWVEEQILITTGFKVEEYEAQKKKVEQDSTQRSSEYLSVLRRNVLQESDVGAIALNLVALGHSEQLNSDLRLQVVLYELKRDKPEIFNRLSNKIDEHIRLLTANKLRGL